MKIYSAIICLATAAILVTSCRKETVQEPNLFTREPNINYDAVGFWRGQTWELFHVGILNRSNGSARLYLKIPGRDTANALGKFEGFYFKNGSAYEFIDTVNNYYVEANFVSPTRIEGLMLTNIGEAVDLFVERK